MKDFLKSLENHRVNLQAYRASDLGFDLVLGELDRVEYFTERLFLQTRETQNLGRGYPIYVAIPIQSSR